jgi:hypothetical protein
MRNYRVIEVSLDRVVMRDGGDICSFAWSEVRRIVAYKRDLITTDQVCLEFELGDRTCIADEEASGWEELTSQMTKRFSLDAEWLARVVQPAFATNMAVLWDAAVDRAR